MRSIYEFNMKSDNFGRFRRGTNTNYCNNHKFFIEPCFCPQLCQFLMKIMIVFNAVFTCIRFVVVVGSGGGDGVSVSVYAT